MECKLESLKNRSPFPGSTPVSMRKDDISPSGSRTSSVKSGSMSQGYGTISNYSGSDKDSIEGNVIPPGGTIENVDNDANVWGEDEWDDDGTLTPPPPPPPPPMPGMKPQTVTCVALYPYDGDTESNIPMTEGEEFIVTEPDQGGWIKVRRIDDRFHQDFGEGYVPTAFVRIL